MRFEIYRDIKKEYRWRFRAKNKEIIAHGESYKSKQGVKHAISIIKKDAPTAKIVSVTKPRP